MAPAGRPEIGPSVHVRLSDELLAAVDAYAERHQIKRAEAIRRLVQIAIEKEQ